MTPRKRGLKQSYFIFFATFLFITIGSLIKPFPHTGWIVIPSLILIFVGSFRAVYALAFESNEKVDTFSVRQASIDTHQDQPKKIKESDYIPPAFESPSAKGDLAPLITESTTKQLGKELEP